jgi:hypothetical protein
LLRRSGAVTLPVHAEKTNRHLGNYPQTGYAAGRFEGYLERGFVAETGDVEKLTKLLGHAPRRYQDFAAETAALWK